MNDVEIGHAYDQLLNKIHNGYATQDPAARHSSLSPNPSKRSLDRSRSKRKITPTLKPLNYEKSPETN